MLTVEQKTEIEERLDLKTKKTPRKASQTIQDMIPPVSVAETRSAATSQMRPFNKGRLRRMEEQYMQKIPTRAGRNDPAFKAKTQKTDWLEDAPNANEPKPYRETWLKVWNDPAVIVEQPKMKWLLN